MVTLQPMGHGRYRLLRRIGVGGMAEVFEAVVQGDAGFERRVAIKRMRGADLDPAYERMFLDEARIASRLSHANVVAVLDYGVVDGRPFQVLELVDGIDASQLGARLEAENRTIPCEIALYICVELGHGLACAHEAVDTAGIPLGIVHRDVSPHNVLVSWAGDVKLSDFGIAFAHDRSERTSGGVAKGKLAYMAPEQALGGRVDGRTDVFALGCVLHALLAGASPLADPDALSAFLAGDPLPIADDLPSDVRAIVERATARARHDRFESAREMTNALGVALAKRIDRDPKSMLAELLRPLRDSIAPLASDLDVEIEHVAGDARSFRTVVMTPRPAAQRRRWLVLATAVLGGAAILATVSMWPASVTVDADAGSQVAVTSVDVRALAAIDAWTENDTVASIADASMRAVPAKPIDAGSRLRDAGPPRPPVDAVVARPTATGYVKVVGPDINQARVIIDRVFRAMAPTKPIPLSVGPHQLVLELADGTSIGPFVIIVDERSNAGNAQTVRCSRTACR